MLTVATVLTTIFTHIDDYCKKYPSCKTGPKPKMSDSEIITLSIFCELSGKSSEYAHTRHAKQWLREYFPHMIDRSRYHRRIKILTPLINRVRVELLPFVADSLSICLTDSTPVPVITFQRACYTPLFGEASYGYCAARKMNYYGFKLHLVTNVDGIPIHFEMTPANVSDVSLVEETLSVLRNCLVLADKGYISKTIQEKLLLTQGVELLCPLRKNQKDREKKSFRQHISKLRQMIETTNGMLKNRFSLEKTLAKTLLGLVARVVRKITAFTFGVFLNKQFGRNSLDIASLVN